MSPQATRRASAHQTPVAAGYASTDLSADQQALQTTTDSPTAPAMSRKRTLEAKGTPVLSIQAEDGSVTESSPYSLFESRRARHSSSPYARSQSTAASSPMARTASNSSFSSLASGMTSDESDAGDFDEPDTEDDEDDGGAYRPRPRIKRRRTAPGSTPITLVPRLGRKKVLVAGKSLGRNELIADYVLRKTGEVRSRKQVSSHIQVLKNLRKDDAHFLWMVNEPKDDIEEDFSEENALKFFGGPRPIETEAPMMAYTASEKHLSPYSPVTLQRSYSSPSMSRMKPARLPSAIDLASTRPSTPGSAPMSATSSLTNAMSAMHFPSPPDSMPSSPFCPISPASFALWADNPRSRQTHIFAEMNKPDLGHVAQITQLEELPLCNLRYPMIEAMGSVLPCQFLHVDVRLNIPYADVEVALSRLHAKVVLSSSQDHSLTAITSIYSYGTQVLSLEEDLPSARRLAAAGGQHGFAYDAPFACDFFSIFLRGAFSGDAAEGSLASSFAKSGHERSEFAVALSGLSVVQEFVVRSTNRALGTDGKPVSPGSALGEVILVVTYDLSCSDATAGDCSLSRLSISQPAGQAESNHSSASGFCATSAMMAPPPLPPLPMSSNHGRQSPSKPNLSLHIPPAEQFVAPCHASQGRVPRRSPQSQPTTPWPQVIHTPTVPPPLHTGVDSAAEQIRLERAWARQSNPAWAMESPALMGAFPSSVGNYTHAPYFAQPMLVAHAAQGGPLQHTAINDLTAGAMTGSPPQVDQFSTSVQETYKAPFVVHPEHAYAPNQEELHSRSLMDQHVQEQAERARQLTAATPSAAARSVARSRNLSMQETRTVSPTQLTKTSSMPSTCKPASAVEPLQSAQDYFTNLLGASKYS
ncbi:hypothetical protein OIV83_001826 [Microbotryomycetes sp. JL201]|nr:hypothetical protein OIV83_001826 [Microbotryomycetes sp. JL201]